MERNRRQLDARNHSNRMLGWQHDASGELGAADELSCDTHRAVRFIVRVVRRRSIRLDVRRSTPSLIHVRERHHGHDVELREREHREREPEPAWAFTNRRADGRHEQ